MAREHSREFANSLLALDSRAARNRPAVELLFFDDELIIGEGGNLREVRHDEHLMVLAERRKRPSDD